MLFFIYDFDYLDISICVLTESCFKNLFEGLEKQAWDGQDNPLPKRLSTKYVSFSKWYMDTYFFDFSCLEENCIVAFVSSNEDSAASRFAGLKNFPPRWFFCE